MKHFPEHDPVDICISNFDVTQANYKWGRDSDVIPTKTKKSETEDEMKDQFTSWPKISPFNVGFIIVSVYS